jgi:hypothetical protein
MHLARRSRSLIPVLAIAAIAANASAQSVRGVLLDAVTTRPVAQARVSLLDSLGVDVASVVTDSSGRFLLASPEAGQYRMLIRRIGYQPATSGPVSFQKAKVWQLTLELAPLATELEPVTIRERTGRQWAVDGFREREAMGHGIFLDHLEILARDPVYIADLFRGMPGMKVELGRGGPTVESREGRGCLKMFVNWLPLESLSENGQRTMELPPPKDVMGVEVYREFKEVPQALRHYARSSPPAPPELIVTRAGRVNPAARPPERGVTPGQCGLVLIWTKATWNR